MTDKKPKVEPESEEYQTFVAAMKQIVKVEKIDIINDLPQSFKERKPAKKATKKKAAKKMEF
jgi:hypothetical protein